MMLNDWCLSVWKRIIAPEYTRKHRNYLKSIGAAHPIVRYKSMRFVIRVQTIKQYNM